jgi:RNA polymerase sigma factor (TIGR02999 family)
MSERATTNGSPEGNSGGGEADAVEAPRADTSSFVLSDERYEEIRRIAAAAIRRERADHTLQATAVAHEVWLRLGGRSFDPAAERDPVAVRALIARVVRNVLVDHARARNGPKRGQGWRRVPMTAIDARPDSTGGASSPAVADLLEVDEALEQLRAIEPRQAAVAELRLFGGFTHQESALRLGVSPATIELEWKLARRFLRIHLGSLASGPNA